MLPAPVVERHGDVLVVRDDLLPGGTKRRAIPVFFNEVYKEYVYASPVQGAAQLALAYTAREHGKRCTIVCAKRKVWHENTQQCFDLGANIVEVPNGFLNVVTAAARHYCQRTGAKLLPFGLDDPHFIVALADIARNIPIEAPKEVWSITSSGVLTRALQLAWPHARFFGVRVGHAPDAGTAEVFIAPERFEQAAKFPPPFPSCSTYDAKTWHFIQAHASPGALFWNVSA